ncbi:glycoside hydrolase family 88 protein [Bacteroides sp. 51]|uniref:glycoside hydrolase family 88 protein n=1 Tax=Bacteroides sp. 51 TaxID=2302938 RepID=UPI0013D06591|nr:glycoside hydrolase family 88 protein [Bacteroides sp. 51]NDV82069.1 glycosyl hydrolase family 88 [Bacteroides sp. 51]
MKTLRNLFTLSCLLTLATACTNPKNTFIAENVDFAAHQTALMLEKTGEPTGKNYPRTMNDKGELVTTNMYDWTPGFFPGNLWYLYELTEDTVWRDRAKVWTHSLEPLKTFTGHHDLGFMIYCSYGNAYRLAPKPEYKDIIIQSAESLITRFDERTQAIKSWNRGRNWDGKEWYFPVIVDNMMNLEMLFAATKLSGDKRFYDIAVTHANTTIKNHIRQDYDTYHVVDFDTITGTAADKATAQGYSDNSTWARGQAWIVYGFTMMYRETQDETYLKVAKETADYFLTHLPEDMIPVWDFNVDQEGYVPGKNSNAVKFREKLRDASAGAIVCSALFELADLAKEPIYSVYAMNMLKSLSSPQYRAALGTNANFLIEHCVGSIPHNFEIDKPLVYADYYYLEALVRYKNSNLK